MGRILGPDQMDRLMVGDVVEYIHGIPHARSALREKKKAVVICKRDGHPVLWDLEEEHGRQSIFEARVISRIGEPDADLMISDPKPVEEGEERCRCCGERKLPEPPPPPPEDAKKGFLASLVDRLVGWEDKGSTGWRRWI
jgi:hypothetical protein